MSFASSNIFSPRLFPSRLGPLTITYPDLLDPLKDCTLLIVYRNSTKTPLSFLHTLFTRERSNNCAVAEERSIGNDERGQEREMVNVREVIDGIYANVSQFKI